MDNTIETYKIEKYINGTADASEIREVELWICTASENTKLYNQLKHTFLI